MQHRSGRTGRAGKKGVSVLLVPNSRRRRADFVVTPEQALHRPQREEIGRARPGTNEIDDAVH